MTPATAAKARELLARPRQASPQAVDRDIDAILVAIDEGAGKCTDLRNARRLVDRYRDELRHVHGMGWIAWDGKRWAKDQGAAELRAQTLPALVLHDVDLVRQKAVHASPEDAKRIAEEVETLAKWAKASASEARIRAALSLAAPQLAIDAADLDADPMVLNVENGTLDLRTGELRPHDPGDLLTAKAPVSYDPEAKAPRWEALVEWAMGERPSLVSYLHKALGYSISGDTSEQVMFFPLGSGANGKSTTLGAVLDTLGEDYAVVAMADLLVAAQGERHATELMHLRGARIVVCSETEDGRRLAVQRMKQLTGESRITARAMRRDPVTFRSTCKLWLQSNHRPEITESTHAVWRRMRVIPFDQVVKDEDRHLADKLRAERPGILAWLVRGCLAWQAEGLGLPAEVAAAVEDYRLESDALAGFIAGCCVTGEAVSEPAMPLYEAYCAWCRTEGVKALDPRKFKGEMVSRGFESKKTMHANVYQGLTLANGRAGDAYS